MLSQDQEDQLKNYDTIYRDSHYCRENSGKGAGKTRTACQYAVRKGYDMFVVCPPGIIRNWETEAQTCGATILDILSYDKLKYIHQDGHTSQPYLNHSGDEYYATEHLMTVLSTHPKPILLIYDEVQNIKRETTKNLQATHTLSRELVAVNTKLGSFRNYIMLISASPYEDVEFAINTLRAAGIIKIAKYEANYAGEFLDEIVEYCNKIDAPATAKIVKEHRMSGANKIGGCVAQLMQDVIGPRVNASMPIYDTGFSNTYINKFYKLAPADYEIIAAAELNRKRKIGAFRARTGNYKKADIDKPYFQDAERAKINVTVADVIQTLTAEPTSKAIVFISSLKSFDIMVDLLAQFNPLIYNGKIKVDRRPAIHAKFQEPNTNYRVILVNPKVGGVGLSFDDHHGGFPRRVWDIPNDEFQTQFQAEDRHARRSTKSDTRFIAVYAEGIQYEEELLARNTRKRDVVAESIGHAYPVREIVTVRT